MTDLISVSNQFNSLRGHCNFVLFFFQFDSCYNACDYDQEVGKTCGFLPASLYAFLAILFFTKCLVMVVVLKLNNFQNKKCYLLKNFESEPNA